MNWPDFVNRRSILLHDWAIQDLRRGIAEGFPLLQTVPIPRAQLFIEYAAELDDDRKTKLASQMVGVIHHTALLALNRVYAEEDRAEYELSLEFEGEEFSIQIPFRSLGEVLFWK